MTAVMLFRSDKLLSACPCNVRFQDLLSIFQLSITVYAVTYFKSNRKTATRTQFLVRKSFFLAEIY